MSRGESRRAARSSAATQESLAESEARHRVMVHALTHGVVLQDADGTILAANPLAVELLGLDEAEREEREGGGGRRGPDAPPQQRRAQEPVDLSTAEAAGTDIQDDAEGEHEDEGEDGQDDASGAQPGAGDDDPELGDLVPGDPDADETDLTVHGAVIDIDDEDDDLGDDPDAGDVPPPRRAGRRSGALIPSQGRGATALAVASPAPTVTVHPAPAPTAVPAGPGRAGPTPADVSVGDATAPASRPVAPALPRTLDLTSPDQAPMLALRNGTTTRKLAGPLRAADGRSHWLSLTAVPLLDDDGSAHAVVTTVSDGTADRENELALRRSEDLFRQTMEHTPVGFAILAVDGRFLRVNRMLCRHFGYRADELHQRRLVDLVHPDDRLETSAKLDLVMTGEKESVQLERRFVGHGEMVVWCLVTLSLVRDEHGDPQLVIAQLQDVSEIRKAHELLTHMALHDPLTGLPNRTLVLDRIQKSLDRSRRSSKRVAVLVCDLDHFKVVNDGMGHELGDAVIVEVSKRLQRALRASDTAGRIGGDEFVVVCEDVEDEREAIAVAERIQRAVAEPATVGDRTVTPTISIGIAVSSGPAAEPLTLIRDADTAKYRAKEYGRNRWDIVDVALRKQATERLDLEQSLRHGLESGQLRLHFQPIVDLATRAVVGREALLRWVHPERGLLAPGEFLHVAEESGLITDIGRWVVGEATRIAARAKDTTGYVAVNVSPSQVARPGLADTVEKALADAGLPPERLVVELTESVMLSAAPAARKEIARLDDFGVRIAVDDFGTGFSALSYLRDLPVSGIKVDRSFTAGLGVDHQCERIVEALTGLGKGLGVDVVVEGVETEAQRELLGTLGCEHAQGYLFGRPVPNYDPIEDVAL
jgi:diguanylate cyclase (GGDEF)-like protein/PAS domain S-box-containing protein